jgi:hypothetical protein
MDDLMHRRLIIATGAGARARVRATGACTVTLHYVLIWAEHPEPSCDPELRAGSAHARLVPNRYTAIAASSGRTRLMSGLAMEGIVPLSPACDLRQRQQTRDQSRRLIRVLRHATP